jgi:hypothetical protein
MKRVKIAAFIFTLSFLQYCSSGTSLNKENTMSSVSYEKDIKPIMLVSCTPCHFPEKGKKKLLNSHEATVDNIDDILKFIQLPKDNDKFMPYKSKKEPLTDSLINVFKMWKTQGMAK